MSKESIVFFLGMVVFILPYLGIPDSWKLYMFTISGVILTVVGYLLRQKAYIRSIEKEDGERDTDSFMENIGTRNKEEPEIHV